MGTRDVALSALPHRLSVRMANYVEAMKDPTYSGDVVAPPGTMLGFRGLNATEVEAYQLDDQAGTLNNAGAALGPGLYLADTMLAAQGYAQETKWVARVFSTVEMRGVQHGWGDGTVWAPKGSQAAPGCLLRAKLRDDAMQTVVHETAAATLRVEPIH